MIWIAKDVQWQSKKVGEFPVKMPLSRSSYQASRLRNSTAKRSAPLRSSAAQRSAPAQRSMQPQRSASQLRGCADCQRQPAALVQSGGPICVSALTLIRSRRSQGA